MRKVFFIDKSDKVSYNSRMNSTFKALFRLPPLRRPTWLTALKAASTSVILLGGVLFSINIHLGDRPDVFYLFLSGHIGWMIAAIRMRDRAIFFLNSGLMALDIYAICVRIFSGAI